MRSYTLKSATAFFVLYLIKILCIAKLATVPLRYLANSIDQLTRIFLFTQIKSTSENRLKANYFALLNTKILYLFILLSFKRICNSTVTMEQRPVALLEHFSNLFISNIEERSSWKKP